MIAISLQTPESRIPSLTLRMQYRPALYGYWQNCV